MMEMKQDINNILFICCAYSHTQAELFQTKSKRGYQFAAQNFQTSLIDGFVKNENVNLTVLSVPSLSIYPKGCKLLNVKDSPFVYEGWEIGKSFGYLNLPFLNKPNKSRVDKYINEWYENAVGDKCIIVYAMLKKQMQYAVEAKKRYTDIKLCLVIPDMPIYMACNKYYKMLGLKKRDMQVIDKLLHFFDCNVVLAKPMVEQLKIADKPYAVIEGIYSELNADKDTFEKFSKKTIMYAGGIVSRYGVFDLIEAFHRIKNDNYQLLLCGPCPEMEKLNSYLSSDTRIEYRGLIPTAEVRKLQKQVLLLINPRHSIEEFTKYSFPSKTLEYMASGTPVLMSSLPSMPDEYKEHLFLFEDESISGMSCMIEKVLSYDEESLKQKGYGAKDFILREKQSGVQVAKIYSLISR